MQNLPFPEASSDPYCNINVNSGTETFAAYLVFMRKLLQLT